MNLNSAPGPDGIGGKYYQVCFDIIKDDLLVAVQSFLMVMICLKLIIQTNLRIFDLLVLVILLTKLFLRS